ncbi:hypothetical protein Caci_3051 [Catenulispora acidiphila DSM 44928]|uniref:Uncharacterized protein n=1 Tax=Catenulispora acidiphila (strain DSM 44928 / JCM 14897 / NBRC 102108 / NRRL B-24433 / ID139908) TaxID=479433 RepID=C7Q4J1_CATAD|nr:hypothetical protein [Catenulispora acidiphila]ACU71960.1 hypothetical protein Caci_3051 [Catenulispora acidiphila DSM 44928]
MSLIDEVLDAVTDPESGLFDALYAADTAAAHLKRAGARRNGTLGSEKVYRRAQGEVESASRLASGLDEPFRGLFDVLLGAFHELDAYRFAAAMELQDDYALAELEYAEAVARKALTRVLDADLRHPVAAQAGQLGRAA